MPSQMQQNQTAILVVTWSFFYFIEGNALPEVVVVRMTDYDLNNMTTRFLRKLMGNIGSCGIWPSLRTKFTEF